MAAPDFTNGPVYISDYGGRRIELSERAWDHITQEKHRRYLADHYGEIVHTLTQPDCVRNSTKEKNVVIYERRIDDFDVVGVAMGRAWLEIVVNWNTNRLRTVYVSIHERKQGSIIWPTKN